MRSHSHMPQDVDELTVNYPSMFELMDDLRGMGESNAVQICNSLRSNEMSRRQSDLGISIEIH